MEDAVVTAAAAVTCVGETALDVAAAVGRGALADREITAFECAAGEPTRACEITEFDLARYAPSVRSYVDRTSALALAAAGIALNDASLAIEAARAGEIGLVYGTRWGCVDSMELFYGKLKGANPRFAPPLPFSHSYANSPASVIAIEHKLRGYHLVVSSGRTSGAMALVHGLDAVNLGRAECVVCVASDALSRAVFSLYAAEGRLLPDDIRSPHADDARVVLGEGAAAVVVESAKAAERRGARVLARVVSAGWASAADAAIAVEDAARAALVLGATVPGEVVAAVGTAASAAGREAELRGCAAALERPVDEVRPVASGAGAVLGETSAASGPIAVTAAVARPGALPALVVCVDDLSARPSAVAILLARA